MVEEGDHRLFETLKGHCRRRSDLKQGSKDFKDVGAVKDKMDCYEKCRAETGRGVGEWFRNLI